MYCPNCGQKLEGGEFCTNCGTQIVPSPNSQAQNSNYAMNSTASRTTIQRNNKTMFAVIGGFVALVIVIFVLTNRESKEKNIIPYRGNTYYNAQDIIQPPIDYSNGSSGYSYDYYYGNPYDDSYDYGNSSQTCPSCYGCGTCPICNGTGQYSMYGSDYSTCTACGGLGDCSICGGDGVC